MNLFRLFLFSAISLAATSLSPAFGQSAEANLTKPPFERKTTFTGATQLYLKKIDGRWKSSLTGDTNDLNTEKIEIRLTRNNEINSLVVLAPPFPKEHIFCRTKMKDRAEFGYLTCNSAFYSLKTAETTSMTIGGAVATLGIMTLSDALSGNTPYTVTLDKTALDVAVIESKAHELALASIPLMEYRDKFNNSKSPEALRTFIATFENQFDPEGLVTQAKEKLPAAIDLEVEQLRQKSAAAANLAEQSRQKKIENDIKHEALLAFRNQLKPGDLVAANCNNSYQRCLYKGMLIELKRPLAYVQWDNVTPPTQWVRLDNLFPSQP